MRYIWSKIMCMKYMVLAMFAMYALSAMSQTSKKDVYKGGVIYYNEDGRKHTGPGKPWGKSVTVVYDSFFKNYSVTYTDSKGVRRNLDFDYSEGSGFTAIYKNGGVGFVVCPMTEEYTSVTFISIRALDEYDVQPTYYIDNLVKQKTSVK